MKKENILRSAFFVLLAVVVGFFYNRHAIKESTSDDFVNLGDKLLTTFSEGYQNVKQGKATKSSFFDSFKNLWSSTSPQWKQVEKTVGKNADKNFWDRAINEFATKAMGIDETITNWISKKDSDKLHDQQTHHKGTFKVRVDNKEDCKTNVNLKLMFNRPLEDLVEEIPKSALNYTRKPIAIMFTIYTEKTHGVLEKLKSFFNTLRFPLFQWMFPAPVRNLLGLEFDIDIKDKQISVGFPASQLPIRFIGLMVQYFVDLIFRESSFYLDYNIAIKNNVPEFIQKAADKDWTAAFNDGFYSEVELITTLRWLMIDILGENPTIFDNDEWNAAIRDFLEEDSDVVIQPRKFPKLTVVDFMPAKVKGIAEGVSTMLTPVKAFMATDAYSKMREQFLDLSADLFPDFKGNVSVTVKFEHHALAAHIESS